jgi:hypothetical protein
MNEAVALAIPAAPDMLFSPMSSFSLRVVVAVLVLSGTSGAVAV